jgi:hypothetical protein
MTSFVLLLSRYGWLAECSVRVLRSQPKIFEFFLMANMGLVAAGHSPHRSPRLGTAGGNGEDGENGFTRRNGATEKIST